MSGSFVALVLALAALGAAPAQAASVWVSPADTSVTLGDAFLLRLECDAVADLKGYQLVFSFDAARLDLLDAPPGDVLTGAAGAWTSYLVPDAALPADTAWVDAAKLDGSAHGPGVLAYLRFRATSLGTSPVSCEHVEYRDSQNQPTLPTCAGGEVRVVGPVPVEGRSWGRVKVMYR